MDNCFCVDSFSPNSSHELGEYLYIKLKDIFIENRPIIFLCIGIDASLGNVQNIGKVFIEDSPLHPGLALDKDLPEVGEMNMKGVVNISGNLDFMMLQNTRLFVVMSLADCISNAISYFISKALSNNTLISFD